MSMTTDLCNRIDFVKITRVSSASRFCSVYPRINKVNEIDSEKLTAVHNLLSSKLNVHFNMASWEVLVMLGTVLASSPIVRGRWQ